MAGSIKTEEPEEQKSELSVDLTRPPQLNLEYNDRLRKKHQRKAARNSSQLPEIRLDLHYQDVLNTASSLDITKGTKTAEVTEPVLEPLLDLTESLQLKSKKLDRLRKKQQKKAARNALHSAESLLDLPYELIIKILDYLRPSDVFCLTRTCRGLQDFIQQEEQIIAKDIVRFRYQALEKCFRLPVFLSKVDPDVHPLLLSAERQEIISIHKKPYQHIKAPDTNLLCTCLTCLLRWNALCLVVDFAHWQNNLEKGEPIPMIPRGRNPEWNTNLINANASIVMKALSSPLWHARILETHLSSMVHSIRRHKANKGNQRKRFNMNPEDFHSGTDLFLERSGSPTMDLPFHRDNYYMLETFMPNRSWNSEEQRWRYMSTEFADEMHIRDLDWLVKAAQRKSFAAASTGA